MTPWGVNVPLWILVLLGAAAALLRWRNLPITGGGRWLVLPIAFVAAALAWRDSPTLFGLNLVGLLVCLGLAAIRVRSGPTPSSLAPTSIGKLSASRDRSGPDPPSGSTPTTPRPSVGTPCRP